MAKAVIKGVSFNHLTAREIVGLARKYDLNPRCKYEVLGNAEQADGFHGEHGKTAYDYLDCYLHQVASDIRAETGRANAFHRDAYGAAQ